MEIIRGEDVLLRITIRDKDKNPYDLTLKTVTIKTVIGGVLTTFASPDVTVVTPTYGQITLKLTDVVTETLTLGEFDIDVYISESGEDKIVQVYGQVNVVDRLR